MDTSGWDIDICSITSATYPASVAAVFKNLRLTGVLKNIFLIINVVPSGAPISSILFSTPPSIIYLVPVREPGVFVISSTCDTAAILDNASPLNPNDDTVIRSSIERILLVECLKKANCIWDLSIPNPLSVTRIKDNPPSLISTVTAVDLASIEFSSSSFTIEAGLSTTSPAAILSIVCWSSTSILLAIAKSSITYFNCIYYQQFFKRFCIL